MRGGMLLVGPKCWFSKPPSKYTGGASEVTYSTDTFAKLFGTLATEVEPLSKIGVKACIFIQATGSRWGIIKKKKPNTMANLQSYLRCGAGEKTHGIVYSW